MTINIRTKGAQAEREIAETLNSMVGLIRQENDFCSLPSRDALFQRNQNQSAVGGSDISNPLGLEIEVKRQEQLSINFWWSQCLASAERTGGIPILIFRQNRKAWRVCMLGSLPLTNRWKNSADMSPFGPVKVEVSFPDFKLWFKEYYGLLINNCG